MDPHLSSTLGEKISVSFCFIGGFPRVSVGFAAPDWLANSLRKRRLAPEYAAIQFVACRGFRGVNEHEWHRWWS